MKIPEESTVKYGSKNACAGLKAVHPPAPSLGTRCPVPASEGRFPHFRKAALELLNGNLASRKQAGQRQTENNAQSKNKAGGKASGRA